MNRIKLLIILGSIFLASPLIGQVPYGEDFNSGLPSTWSIVDGGTSVDTWQHVSDYQGNTLNGSPFMVVSSNNASATDTLQEQLVSEPVDVISSYNLHLSFDQFFRQSAGELAYVDVFDGNSWNNVAVFGSDKGSWSNPNTQNIDVNAYKSTSFKIRFRYRDNGYWGYHWAVDNVRLYSACPQPSNLSVTSVNPNSAYIDWQSNGNGSEWQLEFGPTGFAQGTGDTINAYNHPKAIGPLNADTQYDCYVREICQNGDSSDWVGPVTFKTPCNTRILPLSDNMENFNVSSNATGFVCWEADPTNTTGSFRWRTNSGGTTSSNTGPNVDHTTGSSTGIYTYTEASSGSSGDEAMLISSPINLSSTTPYPLLSFWYHMAGSSMGSLHVDVSTDGKKTWINDVMPPLSGAQQTSESSPWKRQLVSLSAYSGQTIHLRFRGVRGSSFGGDMAIDDISIDDGPDKDLMASHLANPTDPGCYSSSEDVILAVVNPTTDSVDFTKDNMEVQMNISGVVNQTFSTTVTDNSLNGGLPMGYHDTIELNMGTINMSTNGIYSFEGYIYDVNGDTTQFNDTLRTMIQKSALAGGTIEGPSNVCFGDTVQLSLTGSSGVPQWEVDTGNGWYDLSGPQSDQLQIDVGPTSQTLYRVEVCGASIYSSIDTLNVTQVPPPTADHDTFCIGLEDTATLQAFGGGGCLSWYDSQTSKQVLNTGNTFKTAVQFSSKTFWVAERAGGCLDNAVVISEINVGAPDGVEITNVSSQDVDLSGWRIAVNDATSINTWNSGDKWDLSGTLSGGTAMSVNENQGGIGNVGWVGGSDEGWVILLNDNDEVVDFAPFEWTQTELQNFNTTVDGVNVSSSGNWSGVSITNCSGNFMRRGGSSDNDMASDFTCGSTNDMGTVNQELSLPFGGCESDRVPVTAYVSNCTSIEENSEDLRIVTYPVPAKDELFVDMSRMKGNGQVDMELFDLGGKRIKEGKLDIGIRNRIDVQGLSRGIYLLKVRSGKEVFHKKVVIQ